MASVEMPDLIDSTMQPGKGHCMSKDASALRYVPSAVMVQSPIGQGSCSDPLPKARYEQTLGSQKPGKAISGGSSKLQKSTAWSQNFTLCMSDFMCISPCKGTRESWSLQAPAAHQRSLKGLYPPHWLSQQSQLLLPKTLMRAAQLDPRKVLLRLVQSC